MTNTLIDTWTARFIDGVLFPPLSPIISQIQAFYFPYWLLQRSKPKGQIRQIYSWRCCYLLRCKIPKFNEDKRRRRESGLEKKRSTEADNLKENSMWVRLRNKIFEEVGWSNPLSKQMGTFCLNTFSNTSLFTDLIFNSSWSYG